MSRHSHLPPRCPLHSRSPSTRALDSAFQTTRKDDELHAKHRRFPSQDSLVDDLLTVSRVTKGSSLRRSVSDPVTILEEATAFQSLESLANELNPISTNAFDKLPELTGGNETGFEGSCVYGPNSPRQKGTLTDSENSMVTALLENVPRNPLQYISVDFPSGFNISESDGKKDSCVGAGEVEVEAEKAARRRSGQRSRVRKLQYIAELERKVEAFQTIGAELASRIAFQFQQGAALAMESKKLRQQLFHLRQEKLIKDGEYESLRNEMEKLKAPNGRHRTSKSASSYFEMGPFDVVDNSGSNWQMLDMGKLSLSGSSVTLKHGVGLGR